VHDEVNVVVVVGVGKDALVELELLSAQVFQNLAQ